MSSICICTPTQRKYKRYAKRCKAHTGYIPPPRVRIRKVESIYTTIGKQLNETQREALCSMGERWALLTDKEASALIYLWVEGLANMRVKAAEADTPRLYRKDAPSKVWQWRLTHKGRMVRARLVQS